MTTRCCAECQQPFTRDNGPTAPVKLREGQPGASVPRLRLTLYGSLCAVCARAALAKRKVKR